MAPPLLLKYWKERGKVEAESRRRERKRNFNPAVLAAYLVTDERGRGNSLFAKDFGPSLRKSEKFCRHVPNRECQDDGEVLEEQTWEKRKKSSMTVFRFVANWRNEKQNDAERRLR